MQRALSLDQSPPYELVRRYFTSSPLFVLLAGLLLAWQGEAVFLSRWSPVTLAMTHLLTLGALGMAMAGALVQLLPVVAGSTLPRLRGLLPALHALLGAGTITLVAAFLLAIPALFALAAALLAPALLALAASLAIALWCRVPDGAAPMVATVRLALGSLVVTVSLGALLALAFARPDWLSLPLLRLTDLHALWGLAGWAGLLLAGVSFQILPMFQLTPLYGRRMERWLGLAVVLALLLVSLNTSLDAPAGPLPAWLLCGAGAAFTVTSLRLLARRPRPPDAMTRFWRLAMGCLLGALVLAAIPAEAAGSGQVLAAGVLLLFGCLYSTVNGMLYKIVPFLLWHGVQLKAPPGKRAVQVKHIVTEQAALRQFRLHALAVALTVAACWQPFYLARAAGVAMALSALRLFWNLWSAQRRELYRHA